MDIHNPFVIPLGFIPLENQSACLYLIKPITVAGSIRLLLIYVSDGFDAEMR